jgi:hypothetical protein
VRAQGTDAKGRGSAQAAATFRLEPSATGSKVLVHTDLTLSGSVAQYGRGVGMIQATASAIMTQFANNLKKQIAASPGLVAAAAPVQAPIVASPSIAPASAAPSRAPSFPPPPPAKPIAGFSLMATVLWNAIKRLFGGRS